MKKFFFFFTLFFAFLLILPVGRALNGLAFDNFNGRLGSFIMFIIGLFFCLGLLMYPTESAPQVFNHKLTKWILAVAVLLLIAPDVISHFVPRQVSPEPEPQPPIIKNDDYEPRPYIHIKDEKRVRPCNFCSGTGTCLECGGRGSKTCHGSPLTCLNGRCPDCHGTGSYNHGSYVSRCITCSGDGLCDICNGAGKVKCYNCSGYGKCRYCNGTGNITVL